MKTNRITDIIIQVVLGLFIAFSIYNHFAQNTVLYINNYLAFFCWVVSVIFIVSKNRYSLVLFELVISLFNIINFNSATYKFGFVLDTGFAKYEPISVNPIILILLVAYIIVNRVFIKYLLDKALYGSEEDRIIAREKSINFYRNKFNDWGDFELNRALTIINDYPEEAQLVIRERETDRKKTVPLPPWVVYPKIDPRDMFWRMGKGEDAVDNYLRYYSSLTEEEKLVNDANYPRPDNWGE